VARPETDPPAAVPPVAGPAVGSAPVAPVSPAFAGSFVEDLPRLAQLDPATAATFAAVLDPNAGKAEDPDAVPKLPPLPDLPPVPVDPPKRKIPGGAAPNEIPEPSEVPNPDAPAAPDQPIEAVEAVEAKPVSGGGWRHRTLSDSPILKQRSAPPAPPEVKPAAAEESAEDAAKATTEQTDRRGWFDPTPPEAKPAEDTGSGDARSEDADSEPTATTSGRLHDADAVRPISPPGDTGRPFVKQPIARVLPKPPIPAPAPAPKRTPKATAETAKPNKVRNAFRRLTQRP
jgi:hypothetical protein